MLLKQVYYYFIARNPVVQNGHYVSSCSEIVVRVTVRPGSPLSERLLFTRYRPRTAAAARRHRAIYRCAGARPCKADRRPGRTAHVDPHALRSHHSCALHAAQPDCYALLLFLLRNIFLLNFGARDKSDAFR